MTSKSVGEPELGPQGTGDVFVGGFGVRVGWVVSGEIVEDPGEARAGDQPVVDARSVLQRPHRAALDEKPVQHRQHGRFKGTSHVDRPVLDPVEIPEEGVFRPFAEVAAPGRRSTKVHEIHPRRWTGLPPRTLVYSGGTIVGVATGGYDVCRPALLQGSAPPPGTSTASDFQSEWSVFPADGGRRNRSASATR